jgi:hypothetical protein
MQRKIKYKSKSTLTIFNKNNKSNTQNRIHQCTKKMIDDKIVAQQKHITKHLEQLVMYY